MLIKNLGRPASSLITPCWLSEDFQCQPSGKVFRAEPVHSVSRFDHKNGNWGDTTLGPVGRLDGGVLHFALFDLQLEASFPVHSPATPDEIVESFEFSKLQTRTDSEISFYASIQYGILPEALVRFIEDEPNLVLQHSIRKAINCAIMDAIETQTFNGNRLTKQLAMCVASSISFDDTTQLPTPSPEKLQLSFLDLLQKIEFPHARECAPMKATVSRSRCPSTIDGTAARDFALEYITYSVDFTKGNEDDDGGVFAVGALLETSTIQSIDSVPIIFLKFHSKETRDVVSCALSTEGLTDFLRPFQYLNLCVSPSKSYEIIEESVCKNSKIPKGQYFNTILEVYTYLRSRQVNVKCSELELAYDASYCQSRSIQYIPSCGFGARIHTPNNISGTIFLASYFIPRPENRSFLGVTKLSIHDYLASELETDNNNAFPATDQCGAPTKRLKFDPNDRVIQTFIKGRPMTVSAFEALDAAHIRKCHSLENALNQKALLRWKTFFLTSQSIDGGIKQWNAIEDAYATSHSQFVTEVDRQRKLNCLHSMDFPQFCLEVWSDQQFCGELLLPPLDQLTNIYQLKRLHKLQSFTDNKMATRFDILKTDVTHPITGWIHFHATWRCLNSKAGRLNLVIRELRDILTENSSSSSKKQVSKCAVAAAPIVIVYMKKYNALQWEKVQQFTPFEMATYFLHKDQASQSMQTTWVWDNKIMGQVEPDWQNYFCWDEPGRLVYEEREIPVMLPRQLQVKCIAHLAGLQDKVRNEVQYDIFRTQLWNLCMGGVPTLMRPYVWMEVSNARWLMNHCDQIFQDLSKSSQCLHYDSSFEYLDALAERYRLIVYDQIEHDLKELEITYGISDDKFSKNISRVLKALVVFSSAGITLIKEETSSERNHHQSTTDKKQQQNSDNTCSSLLRLHPFKFTCDSIEVGDPIAYSRSLCHLVYFLFLEFDGIHLTLQEAFYLVYALTGSTILKEAPFHQYFKLFPQHSQIYKTQEVFAEGITGPVRDCIFLRSAIEILLPKESQVLKRAGFHYEEVFYSAFTNLFAGYLPTQSLWRLWDILFCVIISPRGLVNSKLTLSDVQRAAEAQANSPRRPKNRSVMFSGVCCQGLTHMAIGLDQTFNTFEDPNETTNVKDLFGSAPGRRILIAFSFSLMSEILNLIAQDSTAQEITSSIISYLTALRNPSQIVLMVEKGDFHVFSSEANFKHISINFMMNLECKFKQLRDHRSQNRLLSQIEFPQYDNESLMPLQVAVVLNRNYTGPRDLFTTVSLKPGLQTTDLHNIMYPMLKYQALYAQPILRSLPPGVLGCMIIKIDALDSMDSIPNAKPIFQINIGEMQQQIHCDEFVNTTRFLFRSKNVFTLNITSPPPYKIDVCILNGGEVIGKLKNGLHIQKLLSQGETFRVFHCDEIESKMPMSIYLSWYMFTKTSEMFMPPLNGHELFEEKLFKFGGKLWGDATGFYHMNTDINTDLIIKSLQNEKDPFYKEGKVIALNSNALIVPFKGHRKPPSRHGLTKAMLDELLFYSMPSLLPFTEELVIRFGQVYDRENFQTVINTEVALREIVAAIILISKGTVLDKANLLFDLFGHHDPAKPNKGQFHVHYNLDPYTISPLTSAVGEKLTPLLPEGCLLSIRKDRSSWPNCISLAEGTALLQTTLLRNLIPVDNIQAFQMAALLFEPLGEIPRVLKAILTCLHENEFEDVTLKILKVVANECGETGLYGINFTRKTDLESLHLIDPYPNVPKKLIIYVTPDGSLKNVDKIEVDVDELGHFTTGKGGNYNDIVKDSDLPRHLQKMGTFSKRQSDFPADHHLINACYFFDYHSIVIDKYLFLCRFIASDLLTEPLRRVTSMDRNLIPRKTMSFDVKLDIPFDTIPLKAITPFKFDDETKKTFHTIGEPHLYDINLEHNIHNRRIAVPTATHAAFRDEEFITTSSSSSNIMKDHHPAYDEEKKSTTLKKSVDQQDPNVGGEIKVPAFVKIILKNVKNLIAINNSKLQCLIKLGSQTLKSSKLEASNEQFIFYYLADTNVATFLLTDGDEVIGEGSIQIEDLWRQGDETEMSITLFNKDQLSVGEFEVQFLFLDPPQGDYCRRLKVTLHSLSKLDLLNASSSFLDQVYLNIIFNNGIIKTEKKAIQDDNVTMIHQVFDLQYNLERDIRFEIMGSHSSSSENEVLGGTSIDLWTFVRKQKKQISGSIPLTKSNGTLIGALKLSLQFYTPPSPPFPEGLKIYIKAVESVLDDDTNFSAAKELYLKCFKKKESQRTHHVVNDGRRLWHFDTFLYFDYEGENEIYFELWDKDGINDDYLGSGCVELWNLLLRSKKTETIKFDLKKMEQVVGIVEIQITFQHKPLGHLPDFCVCKILKVTDLNTSNVTGELTEGLVMVALGDQKGRTPIGEVKDSSAADSVPTWNSDIVQSYHGEKFSFIELRVCNSAVGTCDIVVGSGMINLWSVLEVFHNKFVDLIVPIYEKFEKVGEVVCSIDFFSPPSVVIPEALRLIVRKATQLQGGIIIGSLFVKVVNGEHSKQTTSRIGVNGNINFEDEELLLPVSSHQMVFEVWHDDQEILVGYGEVMLWNLFRKIDKPWIGQIQLCIGKNNNRRVSGLLEVILQLISKPAIAISFNTVSEGYYHDHKVYIYEDDTLATFKKKIVKACRQIASAPSVTEEVAVLYKSVELNDSHHISIKTDQKIYELNDKKTFEDYKDLNIWIDPTIAHNGVVFPTNITIEVKKGDEEVVKTPIYFNEKKNYLFPKISPAPQTKIFENPNTIIQNSDPWSFLHHHRNLKKRPKLRSTNLCWAPVASVVDSRDFVYQLGLLQTNEIKIFDFKEGHTSAKQQIVGEIIRFNSIVDDDGDNIQFQDEQQNRKSSSVSFSSHSSYWEVVPNTLIQTPPDYLVSGHKSVVVAVVSGSNLPKCDASKNVSLTKMNHLLIQQVPYCCVVNYGTLKQRTTSAAIPYNEGSSSVQWNEVFVFPYCKEIKQIQVQVVGDLQSDDYLGQCQIDLDTVTYDSQRMNQCNKWNLLDREGTAAGEITMSIKLLSSQEPTRTTSSSECLVVPRMSKPPTGARSPTTLVAVSSTAPSIISDLNEGDAIAQDRESNNSSRSSSIAVLIEDATIMTTDDNIVQPYVVMKVGSQTDETTKVSDSKAPAWHSTHEFRYTGGQSVALSVVDGVTENIVGSCEIETEASLSSIDHQKGQEILLDSKGNRVGVINYMLHFTNRQTLSKKGFELKVMYGKNLDCKGVNEFYVEVKFGHQTQRTSVTEGLDPTWNETLKFDDDTLENDLEFCIWTAGRNEGLYGKAVISFHSLIQEASQSQLKILDPYGSSVKGFLYIKLIFDVTKKKLHQFELTLIDAIQLSESQNPYVKIFVSEIIEKRSETKKNGGSHPRWEETLYIEAVGEEQLRLEVWNADEKKFDDDNLIGVCAFYLRNDLYGIVQKLKLRDLNGRDAGYMNIVLNGLPQRDNNTMKDFVLTVISGKDLYKDDIFQNQDLYLKIESGNLKIQTFVQTNGGVNPVWNQKLSIIVPNTNDIKFECYNKNLSKDDFIGSYELSIQRLLTLNKGGVPFAIGVRFHKSPLYPLHDASVTFPFVLQLIDSKGRPSGEVYLSIALNNEILSGLQKPLSSQLQTKKIWIGLLDGSLELAQKQNVYVEVFFGSGSGMSKIATQTATTLNWYDVIELPYQGDNIIRFELWDESFVGSGEVIADKISINESMSGKVKLTDQTGRSIGFIRYVSSLLGAPNLAKYKIAKKATIIQEEESKHHATEENVLAHQEGHFWVTCINATNLQLDVFHAQAPYVKVLLNSKTRATKMHRNGGSNPKWNEVLEMQYTCHDKILRFEVWDRDTLTCNDLIGFAEVEFRKIIRGPTYSATLALIDGRGKSAGHLNCIVDFVGPPLLALNESVAEKAGGNEEVQPFKKLQQANGSSNSQEMQSPSQDIGRLWFACLNGEKLPGHDAFNAQDLYVEATIGKNSKRSKTHKRKGSDPVWNEVLELSYSAKSDILCLRVWDNDAVTDDDPIGSAKVEVGKLMDGSATKLELFDKNGKKIGLFNYLIDFSGPPVLLTAFTQKRNERVEMTAVEISDEVKKLDRVTKKKSEILRVQRSKKLTETYIKKLEIEPNEASRLWIACLNGIDLPQIDAFHVQHLHVKATIGKNCKKSKKHNCGGSNPVWNEVLELSYCTQCDILRLEVWDADDAVTRNCLIGFAEVEISELVINTSAGSYKAPLLDEKGKKAGFLHFLVDFCGPPTLSEPAPLKAEESMDTDANLALFPTPRIVLFEPSPRNAQTKPTWLTIIKAEHLSFKEKNERSICYVKVMHNDKTYRTANSTANVAKWIETFDLRYPFDREPSLITVELWCTKDDNEEKCVGSCQIGILQTREDEVLDQKQTQDLINEYGDHVGILYYRFYIPRSTPIKDRSESDVTLALSIASSPKSVKKTKKITGCTLTLKEGRKLALQYNGPILPVISFQNRVEQGSEAVCARGRLLFIRESFHFSLNAKIGHLSILFYGIDNNGADFMIGKGHIQLKSIAKYTKGQPYSGIVELVDDKGNFAGNILFDLTFVMKKMEHKFIIPPYNKLEILIRKGVKLHTFDSHGNMECYCEVIVGDQKLQTGSQMGRDPCWNQKLRFQYSTEQQISLIVVEKNYLTKDNLIGECTIQLLPLLQSGETEHTDLYDIRRSDGALAGKVSITVKLLPQ